MLVPTSRIQHVWGLVAEAAGEDLVGMRRGDLVPDSLDVDHSLFIVDVNGGLGTGDGEATAVRGVVDCVVLGLAVEFDMLHAI